MRVYCHPVPNLDLFGNPAGLASAAHYCGRALVLSEPDDVVQLHPDLETEFEFVHGHYERVGLATSERIVWSLDWPASGFGEEVPHSSFYFGAAYAQDAETVRHLRAMDPRRLAVTDWVNDKNNFIPWAESLGVPVPRTWCFPKLDAFALPAGLTFPCFLKPAVSATGIGMLRCPEAANLTAVLSRWQAACPFQIQEELPATVFLNVLYEVRDGTAKLLAETEQILAGVAHRGNRFPARCSAAPLVASLAQELAARGLREHFAFDVAAWEDASGPRFAVLECNPRFNGSSYPATAAARLGADAWACDSFSTRRRSLRDLDLTGVEYDQERGTGVVLINWGTISFGKLSAMIIGPPAVQEKLAVDFRQRLR